MEIIVKEVLLPLPSFSPPNAPRGSELLNAIVAEARLAWKSESSQDNDRSSIPRTRFFLDLAHEIVVERRISPPQNLLRFYLTTLVPKAVMQILTADVQAFVIKRIAESFDVMQDSNPSEVTPIRNQLVDVSGLLLAVSDHVVLHSNLSPHAQPYAVFR